MLMAGMTTLGKPRVSRLATAGESPWGLGVLIGYIQRRVFSLLSSISDFAEHLQLGLQVFPYQDYSISGFFLAFIFLGQGRVALVIE